jgi:hypothetical protein
MNPRAHLGDTTQPHGVLPSRDNEETPLCRANVVIKQHDAAQMNASMLRAFRAHNSNRAVFNRPIDAVRRKGLGRSRERRAPHRSACEKLQQRHLRFDATLDRHHRSAHKLRHDSLWRRPQQEGSRCATHAVQCADETNTAAPAGRRRRWTPLERLRIISAGDRLLPRVGLRSHSCRATRCTMREADALKRSGCKRRALQTPSIDACATTTPAAHPHGTYRMTTRRELRVA